MGYDFAIRRQSVGFGWFVSEYLTRQVVFHGGGVDGFSSQVDYFADDRIAIMVLANNEAGPAAALAKIAADTFVPSLDVDGSIWAINQRAHFAHQQGQYAEAARLYVLGLEKGDREPENASYAARCFTQLGDADRAFAFLERAVTPGFRDLSLISTDGNMNSLRADPRWPAVIDRVSAASRQPARTKARRSTDRGTRRTRQGTRCTIQGTRRTAGEGDARNREQDRTDPVQRKTTSFR